VRDFRIGYIESNVRLALSVVILIFIAAAGQAQTPAVPRDEVHLNSEQAEAALAIIGGGSDWRRLASSDGYVRLKKREAEMGGPFSDEEFRAFLRSDDLSKRRSKLSAALNAWKRADFKAISQRVRSYLPSEAKLRATVYIVIKPKSNSFVYELTTDPVVFLYFDPAITKEEFENTVAHELHHVGLASLPTSYAPHSAVQASGREQARRFVGAFGEGLAMLAAAGGPNSHPHQHSSAEVRARWDRDVQNFATDLRLVEAFLLDTIAGRLDEKQQRDKVMSFFDIQGPWYTVGWVMAVTVEKAKGRSALIECMNDLSTLLLRYNEAVDEAQPKWSAELLESLLSR
jgi:hypothetical protein